MRRSALGLLAVAVVLPVLPTSAVAGTVDPAPVRSFTTSFSGFGVAREPRTGLLYAPDDAGTVHVYAPSASGSSPAEAFTFAEPPSCGTPTAPTFDASGQNLAINCTGSVGLYSVASDGAVSYRGAVNTGLTPTAPTASVFDPDGKLLVADKADNSFLLKYDVSTLSSPPTPTQLSVTGLDSPLGLAMTASTLYVANNGSSATVLALPYPGGVIPTRTITAPVGVSELRSPQVDDAGNLYVAAFTGGVLVYSPDATAGSAPLKQVSGATSGLGSGTTSVAVDAARGLYVSQLTGGGRFTTFAPLIPVPAVPAPVAGLHVTGKKTAKKRVVRWVAGSPGTAPITSYRVTVVRRTKVVLRRTVTGTSLTIKVRKELRRSGRYKVSVTAVNGVGPGGPSSAMFRVRIG